MSKVWDKRITKAEKYLEKSRVHGRKVYERYKDDREDLLLTGIRRVNIFYSNTNTLKESLFNSLPKPDVSRFHKGDYEDDPSRVAAMILQRALSHEIEAAPSFYTATEYAILDRLVPGTGQVWFRFEAEQVYVDVLYWEDFLYEPARCWDLVTWVGRKHSLEKKDFIERYGEEAFTKAEASKAMDSTITPKEILEGKYCVYEIWDKRKKEVLHILKGVDEPLKTIPDPYKLKKFFPCPTPLIANLTTTAFLPITDYHLAQDQYIELDNLYARMSLITTAIKVAGGYDSASPELATMLNGVENKLIPVDNWAMYAEKGGTKGLIDWYPVEQIVQVFQALQVQYEAVKATLYEVTGMSDIMRGVSNQYETASAQEIKADFASVRMNGYQRDVSHFVGEMLNIMAQMMCALYSDEKFKGIVGGFTEADAQYIVPAMQILRNQLLLCYKVSIQSDSLTQADWAREKGQRMELTGYVSQFLQSAVPAIEQVPELGILLMSMLKFTIAGYKGSAELEGVIDQQLGLMQQKAQQPQPEEPSPEQQKAAAEKEKMAMEAQIKQQESEQKMQLEREQAAADMAVANQKAELDYQLMQAKMDHQQQMFEMELRAKAIELGFKREEQEMRLSSQAASAQIKAQSEKESADAKAKAANDKPKPSGS